MLKWLSESINDEKACLGFSSKSTVGGKSISHGQNKSLCNSSEYLFSVSTIAISGSHARSCLLDASTHVQQTWTEGKGAVLYYLIYLFAVSTFF